MIDTLKLARRWREAGGDADKMVEALADERQEGAATKADLRVLRAELASDISNAQRNTLSWIVGLMIAQSSLLPFIGNQLWGR